MAFLKKLITLLFTVAILSVAAGSWLFYQWSEKPILDSSVENNKSIEFVIKPGVSIRKASHHIESLHSDFNPWFFEALVRLKGQSGNLKAGTYEIVGLDTPQDLLYKIVNGKVIFAKIAIIEGWSFRQMRNAIDAHPHLRHETTGISDIDLLKKIGSDKTHPEGAFFPDTYMFTKGSSDIEVYKNAHQAMQKQLDIAWSNKAANLPYKDRYEALTMASIIEKETGQASERRMIASVFVNRLKIGMLLQTDPTVIYGMGERFQGNIRKTDLQTDTPYNTYTRAGLPPTPIALPGKESLHAALNPEQSNAYYFVARGNGTSQFSHSLEEHNRAVNKYQR